MRTRQQKIEAMKSLGYVTSSEAATIIGRTTGGNIPPLLTKHGVSSIEITCEGCKPYVMWSKDDLDKVPAVIDSARETDSNERKAVNAKLYEISIKLDDLLSLLRHILASK